jgi:prepilin-type N-terminal cleavage/methylation domain-containing protein
MAQKRETSLGFTLVEMMTVVLIVAALAAVAVVAYARHLKRARILEAKVFISTIQARQEAYFQQYGTYINASGANYYPNLDADEPVAKDWNPTTGLWGTLGASPPNGVTYFQYRVTASTAPNHTVLSTGIESALDVPAQPAGGTAHPWYYVVARGNLDGSGNCGTPPPLSAGECTMLYASSARSDIVIMNENE